MGITTGGNILMSQYYGSRDPVNREKTNRTLFFFSVTAGAVMTVAVLVLSRPILDRLRAPALEEATAYLTVCAPGPHPHLWVQCPVGHAPLRGQLPAAFLLRGSDGGGQHRAGLPVYGGLPLGRPGGGPGHGDGPDGQLCGLPVVRPAAPGPLRPDPAPGAGIERAKLTQMLKLGIPSAVQMTVVGLSWLAMTFLINDYGVDASAASGICRKIKDIASCPPWPCTRRPPR